MATDDAKGMQKRGSLDRVHGRFQRVSTTLG